MTSWWWVVSFNAKLESDASTNWPGVTGKCISGQRNVNGERFLPFCAINQLTIINTMCHHARQITRA